jgi:amino acid transporter
MIIALLFSLGNLDEVLAAPVSQLGYPVIQIYYQATGSLHGANAMTAVSLVIVIMAHFGLMAGCSRTAWAFARDRGLPASDYLSHVSTRSQVPFRAIMLSVVIQVLLGLINIGSSAAFLAFVNAAAATLYITYVGLYTPNNHHEPSTNRLPRSPPSSSVSSSAGAANTSHTALSSSADTAMSSMSSPLSTPCSRRSFCCGQQQRTRMHRR